jgi:myo-inositol catabolism protein IolC
MTTTPRQIYMLPFDHRASFEHQMLGLRGPPGAEGGAKVRQAKRLIYEGFLRAQRALPPEAPAMLVDEQYGRDLLADAHRRGIVTACPVERSGQPELLFEYGNRFAEHIEAMDPTFAKVLVRYNVEADRALNSRQRERLRTLSDYLHAHDRGFLFELLVPPEPAQLARVRGDRRAYEVELQPALTIAAIEALQAAGVEPTVWKLEGLASSQDCLRVAEVARRGGRGDVACIVLGRNAEEAQVEAWLRAAAPVPAFIGFAVGRSTFGAPLAAWQAGQLDGEGAADEIARRYLHWAQVFTEARSGRTEAASGPAPPGAGR